MRPRATRRATTLGATILFVVLGPGALAACSDDSDSETASTTASSSTTTTTSPEAAYCEAGEQLRTDITALTNLDLIAEGTNGLTAAVDTVKDDLTELRTAAGSATSAPIDDLEASLDDLSTAMDGVSGEISVASLTPLKAAITDVATSATAVYDTLSACP